MKCRNFLLIEISRKDIKYMLWNKCDESLRISHVDLVEKDNSIEMFYNQIVSQVLLIMQKSGHSGKTTRLYLRYDFYGSNEAVYLLKNRLFIQAGVNLNILSQSLESFYIKQQSVNEHGILNGIASKELRKVVLCGSFRKYLDTVREVYQFCQKNQVEVLSPRNLVLEEMYNDNFALFHGEHISSERETYLIESKHTEAIKMADAIIVCNSDGYIGTRTLYEIGFADALKKRIIFLYQEKEEFDICFPRDYGLLGFS